VNLGVISMQNGQKELGGRDMDVTAARDQHHALITRLMTGPGDSEGAMHRAERQFGLPYWSQHGLRYKRRATSEFIERVRQAYLSMLEASVRRDLDKLKIERARGNDSARIQNLIVEAENLLSRMVV
jgi:hypothetical protein